MFYVRAGGKLVAAHRDILVALDCMHGRGPGSKVETRDGTELAVAVEFTPPCRLAQTPGRGWSFAQAGVQASG